jgi:ribosomal protein S17E
MTRAILVDVGIVNSNVYQMGKRRGVGIGVSAVCAHHDETHGSRRSKEQTHARLIDARGMRMSKAKLGTQYCCARRGGTRYAKDVLLLVSVELFLFRGEPEIPNRELLQLATGERTKELFVGCSFTTDVRDWMRDPLQLRQLKMPLDGRSPGVKSSTVKRVAEIVTQEYVTCFTMQAAEATNRSTVKRVAEMVTQEYVVRFAVQAAGVANTLATF